MKSEFAPELPPERPSRISRSGRKRPLTAQSALRPMPFGFEGHGAGVNIGGTANQLRPMDEVDFFRGHMAPGYKELILTRKI